MPEPPKVACHNMAKFPSALHYGLSEGAWRGTEGQEERGAMSQHLSDVK